MMSCSYALFLHRSSSTGALTRCSTAGSFHSVFNGLAAGAAIWQLNDTTHGPGFFPALC